MKLNRKRSSNKRSSYEVVKLENEVVTFEMFLEWSRDDHVTEMVI
jgi:hypothetical protein